jgi:hypothetical protein
MTDRSIDIRERFEDQTELLETVVDGVLSRLPKAGPVTLAEDSKDGHTAKLQPTTKAVIRKPDGTTEEVTLPVIPDVPVYYASGNGITATFGQKQGQEGFNIPMALGIDGWHQQGGIQSPGDTRQHAMWDTVFVPGIRSDPKKLRGVSPDSAQVRTDDKQTLHDVSHTAITTIRESAAHQVNGMAIQSEKGGSQHAVDAQGVQQRGGKFLWNC